MPEISNSFLKTPDEASLYIQILSAHKPLAYVVIIHGLGEHSGRYEELAEFFRDHQISCVRFDLRGHGRSSGKRGHSKSYDLLMQDISLILDFSRQSFPEIPLFLYGHSMGGNLALNYVLRIPNSGITGLIITSPWLGLSFVPSKFKLFLAYLMGKIWPAYQDNNDLDPKHLSHDPDVAKKYNEDPLVHGKITAGLYNAMRRAAEYAHKHAKDLPITALLIHGTDDPITSPRASQLFAKRAAPQMEIKLFEGMYHETHNETGRDRVMNYIFNWMKKLL